MTAWRPNPRFDHDKMRAYELRSTRRGKIGLILQVKRKHVRPRPGALSLGRWLVRLKGEMFDLEEFPYWFPDGDVSALREGDTVYLTGSVFEDFSDAGEVYEAAKQVLDERFAIISLLQPNVIRPSIDGVIREADSGSRKFSLFGEVNFSARMKMHVDGRVVGTGGETTSPTQAQTLLAGVHRDSHLETAVSLWSDSLRTWPRLYRILEEVELSLGQKAGSAGLCSSRDRTRFARSANAAEVSGKDSRHASGQFEPPTNPMTLEEATTFIAEILRRALLQATG